MDKLYRIVTALITPLLPFWLIFRYTKGKEDSVRVKERWGHATLPRPPGPLMWLHAASVGEANSVLPLIETLRRKFPEVHVLLTTGTVTSARLMQKRLPPGAFHQYAPIDAPIATMRFICYWRPNFAFWVESEFWPNLVENASVGGCFMGIINGRMSDRSFRFWQRHPAFISKMLGRFHFVFAQSDKDAGHFRALGVKNPMTVGNLKYDAGKLSCDEGELVSLKTAIGSRPVWLAASTHPGEEKMVAQIHKKLAASYPNLLTIIVPRHASRGVEIADMLKDQRIALRSRNEAITVNTTFYIADTMGELGLFYRLGEIAFMGGSLIKHGGQNPLEPARLSCAVLAGPHVYNFLDIYDDMQKAGACLKVKTPEELANQLKTLLSDSAGLQGLQDRARQWVDKKSGGTVKLLDIIEPLFRQ